MRDLTTFCLSLALLVAPALAQPQKPPSKPPKKGDAISVKGCLTGGALQATEVEGLEGTGLLEEGLTFRLTGNKALLKSLRDKHDRKLVAVAGVLKSDLPHLAGQTRSVGRMRITIGGVTPDPNAIAENRRVLPVLEVKSFDGGETSCRP
jgi:hypothetical protein